MSKTHPPAVAARAVIYARVSTFDQEPENQLLELRRYVAVRGWTSAEEYVDRGVSGAKDRRPSLDRLLLDARRRRFDVLVVWRLDRLGRSVRHLVNFISELTALGIGFASLGEGIDTNTPSGRLQLHILSALAEFERERIRERVLSGLARARAQGRRLGRPRQAAPTARVETVSHLTVDAAARLLGVSRSTLKRWRRAVQKSSGAEAPVSPGLADVRAVR
jgi:DNA invertase Pin-like site-specific DNA recombinase